VITEIMQNRVPLTTRTTCLLYDVIDGQPFSEHCSHYESYHKNSGEFDFSNRLDAEEIELIMNKPLNIIDGRTVVHVEVHRERITSLSQLLSLGGMFVGFKMLTLCL